MHVERIIMNEAQKAVTAEIDAMIEPLQAENQSYRDKYAVSNPAEIEALKVKIRANIVKIAPLAMIKPAILSPRSRLKYFPEFSGFTAEEVNPDTIEGQSKLAAAALIKDDNETIDRFIESIRPLIKAN